jgi:hypothetical protein
MLSRHCTAAPFAASLVPNESIDARLSMRLIESGEVACCLQCTDGRTVPTGKRVDARGECHWSHAWQHFKRSKGVTLHGILECKILCRKPEHHTPHRGGPGLRLLGGGGGGGLAGGEGIPPQTTPGRAGGGDGEAKADADSMCLFHLQGCAWLGLGLGSGVCVSPARGVAGGARLCRGCARLARWQRHQG